jgi:predicted transposase YdaD
MIITNLDLDGMFKMAFRLSDKLVLKMLGSLFDDDYTNTEGVSVEYGNNEFIGDHLERLQSDIEITIKAGNLVCNYHIEFQTQNDRSMVIRMFRYEKPLHEEVGKMLTSLFDPIALEKSMEKGLEKGMVQGRKEGKLDVAKKMLLEGLGIPLIIKITGLPEEEIDKLQIELKEQSKH